MQKMANFRTVSGKQQKPVKVRANTFTGTVYSQLVSVTITDNDLTLEFVYINPRSMTEGTEALEGEVVARVTLPLEAAKGLPETIRETLTKHFEKKGN